jgi:aspartate carbamoyltransferase regulatory subunit
MGRKGVVKIANRYLTDKEVNRIAIFSPRATLNIIKNFKIIRKTQVCLPDEILEMIKCSNPKCITNTETIKTRFQKILDDPLTIQCCYCERPMSQTEVSLL